MQGPHCGGVEAQRLHNSPVDHNVALRVELPPETVTIVVTPQRPADAIAREGSAYVLEPVEASSGGSMSAIDAELAGDDRDAIGLRPLRRTSDQRIDLGRVPVALAIGERRLTHVGIDELRHGILTLGGPRGVGQ